MSTALKRRDSLGTHSVSLDFTGATYKDQMRMFK